MKWKDNQNHLRRTFQRPLKSLLEAAPWCESGRRCTQNGNTHPWSGRCRAGEPQGLGLAVKSPRGPGKVEEWGGWDLPHLSLMLSDTWVWVRQERYLE